MRPADADRFVVWRLGDALLAVRLEDVVEVGAPGDDGTVPGRDGSVTLGSIPGLPGGTPARALIVRGARGTVALPADEVEGVRAARGGAEALPGWVTPAGAAGLLGVLRLSDDRLAVLVDVEALAVDP